MRIDSNFLSNNFMASDVNNTNNVSNTGSIFSDFLTSVSNQENSVTQMKNEYLNGDRDDIDNILVEAEKLGLQLSFTLEVRNKLVDMFNTLSNMQI